MPNRRKLPKFLTAKQYAAKIGKSKEWVLGMLREERIPDAQLLPVGWIIPEDAQIILRRADMLLPPEFIKGVKPREEPVYSPRGKNMDPDKPYHTVEVPGFERVVLGYSQREVYERTKVHPITQRRIRDGKPVAVDVVRRLAFGMGVHIDELLRRK